MMRYFAALILGLFAASAVAEEGPQPSARVIDSSSDRIPSQTLVPEYPRKARRDRIEGEVQVCFEVTREGRPRRVAVRTSTHRDFEKPSIKAVRASRFRPLGKDEPLPNIKACRTFIFSLEPVEADISTDDEETSSVG